MMNNPTFVGIFAGLASALLFMAVAAGQPAAVAMFYAAPLPLLIAGLGWGLYGVLIAGAIGVIASLAVTGGLLALVYLAGCAVPCIWLVRSALLSRPLDEADPQGPREWYPAGHLVLWTAAFGALVTTATIIALGGTGGAFTTNVSSVLREGLLSQGQIALPEGIDTEAVITYVVAFLPLMSAAVWTLFMVANLWLAGKIVTMSGNALRPMPEAMQMRLPRQAVLGFAAATGLALLGGTIGLYAKAASAALFVAFVLLGLAVVHAVTRGMAARPLILGTIYMFTLLFGWTAVLIAMVGLADPAMNFRDRRKSPPPAGGASGGSASGGGSWPPPTQ